MAGRGSARLGKARRGTARQGFICRFIGAWRGLARLGRVRLGEARLGTAGLGETRHGTARHGKAWRGRARQGKVPFTTRNLKMNNDDKLRLIQQLIRTSDGNVEILKSIADDYRIAPRGRHRSAIDALQFQVDRALKSKARLGYLEVDDMQGCAGALLTHWKLIRLALENLGRMQNE